jgi:putative transposase
MTAAGDEQTGRAERARAVALFRYSLIREAADPALSTRQRGRLVRGLAAREHAGPFGVPVRVSRASLDRWIRAWRSGGFDALAPPARQVTLRTPAEVLELAAALKRENPARTAAQVARVLRASAGWSPAERTLQRHFVRLELTTRPDGSPPPVFGRFEAARPNEMWTGDALHGPVIGGRKKYLFAFIDDHSRLITGHRFGHAEDTIRLAAALRPALASRGVPERIYVDNGSAFVDAWLLRACAVLGARLTHSTPGRPQGRGKIERFQCATKRAVVSPAEPGGTRREVPGSDGLPSAERFLGTRACQLTRGRVQVSGTVLWGTRVTWRKLDCLNPNLQKMEVHIRRKDA